MRTPEVDEAQRALDEAAGARPEDRAENAKGRLGAKQQAKLLGSAARSGGWGAFVGVVGLAGVVDHAAAAGAVLFVGLMLLLRATRPLAEALLRRVRRVEGRIERVRATRYAIVDGTQLAFPPGTFERIPPDVARWRVYYLPWGREVVAIEPADDVTQGAYR